MEIPHGSEAIHIKKEGRSQILDFEDPNFSAPSVTLVRVNFEVLYYEDHVIRV